jgi:putative PIG3 family NAD(P)H quinone oxidoreductase
VRCAIVKQHGKALENLVLEEREDIEATGSDVHIRVTATALNRADLLQRRGLYPPPAGVPHAVRDIPGLEFVGYIDQVGEDVNRWYGGEHVFGIVPGGTYADQVVTHQDLVLEVPRHLSEAEAAAIPEAFITAFDALVLQGGLGSGERVLIHAVGSGVGTAGVQIASAWGAEVAGTAGSRSKLHKVAELAPLFSINYRETDFRAAIEEEFGKTPIDVILDVVGSEYWERNLALLNDRGRLIIVGRMGGDSATISLGEVMSKRLRIVGTVMRSRPFEERVAVTNEFREQIIPLLEDGRLKPVVDSVYAFGDLHKATARMENNENVGKIVLTFV